MEAATAATRDLRGLPAELTACVPRLLEAMRSVGAGLDLHVTLDRLVQTAAELVDARYAAIGVLTASGTRFSDFVSYGVGADVRERLAALTDEGATGAPGGDRTAERARRAGRRCAPS